MSATRATTVIVATLSISLAAYGQDQGASTDAQVLSNANAMKAKVQERQTAYLSARDRLFVVMDAAIERIPETPTDLSAEREAIAGLREVVAQLRLLGEVAIDAHARYLEAANGYQAELPRAADAFERMSEQFRKYQAEEPYQDHKADYAQVAGIFQQLAVRCRSGQQKLQPEIRQVAANLPYMERSVLFLKRLDEALQTIPDFQSGAEYDRLVMQLKNYVATYERMRSSLRQFNQRLTPTSPSRPDTSAFRQRSPYSTYTTTASYTSAR